MRTAYAVIGAFGLAAGLTGYAILGQCLAGRLEPLPAVVQPAALDLGACCPYVGATRGDVR